MKREEEEEEGEGEGEGEGEVNSSVVSICPAPWQTWQISASGAYSERTSVSKLLPHSHITSESTTCVIY